MLLEMLGTKNVGALLDILAVLFGLSLFWAMVKASYQKVTGLPVPRNKFTLALDVLADLANNIPGAANRIARETGKETAFWKEPRK